jgi:hypothetical protein
MPIMSIYIYQMHMWHPALHINLATLAPYNITVLGGNRIYLSNLYLQIETQTVAFTVQNR